MTTITTVVLPTEYGGRVFGRHVEHDTRSLDYDIAHHLTNVDLATVTPVEWRRWSDILDQGQVGSCTGNAMAGWLGSAPHATDPVIGAAYDEAYALRLYELATHLDGFPGAYPPDDTGSSGLAVAKAARQLGQIRRYKHSFTIPSMLAALRTSPVLLGVTWYDSFMDPGPSGVLHLDPSAQVVGGHEVLCRGVTIEDDGTWSLICDNSWGNSWGAGGSFTIPAAVWSVLHSDRADVTIPHI